MPVMKKEHFPWVTTHLFHPKGGLLLQFPPNFDMLFSKKLVFGIILDMSG